MGFINQHTSLGGTTLYDLSTISLSGWWWLEHEWIISHSVGDVIIPIDKLIFFRGVEPPTSYRYDLWWMIYHDISILRRGLKPHEISFGWPFLKRQTWVNLYHPGVMQVAPPLNDLQIFKDLGKCHHNLTILPHWNHVVFLWWNHPLLWPNYSDSWIF